MKYHPGALAATLTLRFGSYFTSWLLGCFALAAIATVVNDLDGEELDSVWIHDSHQRARDHFGGLVVDALFTFCVFLSALAVAGFVEFAAIRVVGWSQFSRFNYGISLAGGWWSRASCVGWG